MLKRLRARGRRLLRAVTTLFAYDVFISYARLDGRRYARRLQRALETSGLVTFLDRSDMLAGDRLDRALANALRRSRLFVLVATDGARVSPYVAGEIGAFLTRGRPIVPVNFGDSYTREPWPRLSSLNLLWLNEPSAALTTGVPGPQVVADLRHHLRSTASRLVVKRIMFVVGLLLAALACGVLWTYTVAQEQGRGREAQRLAARAQIAFDVDQNPLQTLAYAAGAIRSHDSLEAGDAIARALPFTRRPLAGIKVGRFATRVTFSAAGRFLVALGTPNAPASGRLAIVLRADDLSEQLRLQREVVDDVALSGSEDFLAIASHAACVEVVSVSTAAVVTCVPAPGVTQLSFSKNGKFLATIGRPPETPSSASETITVWETRKWQRVGATDVPAFVRGFVFSQDGEHLLIAQQVYGTVNAGACVWEFARDTRCATVSAPPGESMGVSIGPQSSDIQFDSGARAWMATSLLQASLTDIRSGETRRATAIGGPTTIGPDVDGLGPFLITRPPGGVATVWRTSAAAGQIAHLVHPGDITGVQFSPDARAIITTSDDGIVRLWDAGLAAAVQNDFIGSNRLAALLSHGVATSTAQQNRAETIVGLAVAPDSRTLATAGNDGWVRLWRFDAEPDVQRGRHGQWIGAVVPGPTAQSFITASDYYSRIWSLNPIREIRRLRRHENDNQGVQRSRDGRITVTSGDDGRVQVFESSFRYLRTIDHNGSESSILAALADNGSRLVTSGSRLVRVWDPWTGARQGELTFNSGISALAISPDGSTIAAGLDRSVLILDSSEGLTRGASRESDGTVSLLRFDPTGRRLVVGTATGHVSVTDLTGGGTIASFNHVDRVSSAVFSADGRYLVTGSHDRTVRVWDLATLTEVARQTRPFRIDGVALVDGERLLVVVGQNYVQLSPWRQADLVRAACDVLSAVRGESWTRLIGTEVSPAVCEPSGSASPRDRTKAATGASR